MSTNPYSALGLEFGASQQEIKNRYRQLAVKYHPDKSPDTAEKFLEIKRAYETLTGGKDTYEYTPPLTLRELVRSNFIATCKYFIFPGLNRTLTQFWMTRFKLPSDFPKPSLFSLATILQLTNPLVLSHSCMMDTLNTYVPHLIHTRLYRVWGFLPPKPPLPLLIRLLGDFLSIVATFPLQLIERQISLKIIQNQEIHIGDYFNFPRILMDLSKREVAGKTFLAAFLGALVLQLSRRVMDHATEVIINKIGEKLEGRNDKSRPIILTLAIIGTFLIRLIIPIALACPFEVASYRLQSNTLSVASGESFFAVVSRPAREKGLWDVFRGTLFDVFCHVKSAVQITRS